MYGQNTGLLRDSLRELLTQHRIQQRIGGAGIHTVPVTTTVSERQEIGEQIARYRAALVAARPGAQVRAAFITAEGSLIEP